MTNIKQTLKNKKTNIDKYKTDIDKQKKFIGKHIMINLTNIKQTHIMFDEDLVIDFSKINIVDARLLVQATAAGTIYLRAG